MNKLTFTEVSKYLKAIPNDDTDKLVLVGGQALNLWADIYLSEQHELHPFTSKDLDFLINDIKVMDQVTNIWNGKLAINDDITSTHCGVATIEDVQNQIQADFMSGIVGVLTNDVRKKMLTIVLGAVKLNVMHPIHCLESRF